MYYSRGIRLSGRRTESKKVQSPLVKDFSNLQLKDLKKIRLSKKKYDEDVEKYKAAYSKISQYNKRLMDLRRQREEEENKIFEGRFAAWSKTREQADGSLLSICRQLERYRVGLVDRVLNNIFSIQEYVMFNGMKIFVNSQTNRLLEEYKLAKARLDEVMSKRPYKEKAQNPDLKEYPSCPLRYRHFTIAGTRLRIDMESTEFGRINALIAAKEAEISAEKESLNQLRARVSSTEKETRQQAKRYKTGFKAQKKIVSECPYCGGILNESDSHLDHIYPVSKVGQSVKRNLVFVCSGCNIRKKNQTLRSFLLSAGLVEGLVYERLERLGKDF